MSEVNETPKKKTGGSPLEWVKFGSQSPPPVFKEVRGKPWLYFGAANNYPESTLDLYRDCSDHRAIIKGKARFIIGKGLELPETQTAPPLFIKANKVESLSDLFSKVALDWEIHRGFYLRIRWNKAKEAARITHLPFKKVRTNSEGTEFYICKKWGDSRAEKDVETLKALELSDRIEDAVYFFADYDPASDVYPLPDYIAAIPFINIDIQTANFHETNISSGFTAGTMITLFRGEPEDQEKRELTKLIKQKTTGSDQAGEVLIYYAEQGETPPQIDPLRSNDLDKQYIALAELCQQRIFTAHSVTNGMLFGVKTPGQLGGRTELLESWELLDETYIVPNQETLLKGFVDLFAIIGQDISELSVKRLQPISQDILALYQAGLIAKEVAQEMLVLPIDEAPPVKESANVLIDAINGLSPLVANKVLAELTPDEVRGMVGQAPAPPQITPEPTPAAPVKFTEVKEPEPTPEPIIKKDPEPVAPVIQLREVFKFRLWEAYVPGADGLRHQYSPVIGKDLQDAQKRLEDSGIFYVKLTGDEIKADGLTDEEILNWKDDEDLAIFAEAGSPSDDYDIIENTELEFAADISEAEAKVLKTIAGDPKLSLQDLSRALWIDIKETSALLGKLIEKELLKPAPASGGGMTITPTGQLEIDRMGPGTTIISTKYRYNGPRDDKNRPFCARLMDLNRVYDRAEIDGLSVKLGYDVWKRRGGWYRVPGSDPALNVPHCRHAWEQIIVRRRTK